MTKMKISIPNEEKQPNCFLFTDDCENRIYVEWYMDKSELVDTFLDEYQKLSDRDDWTDFYEELAEILKPKWVIVRHNLLNINQ